MEIEVLAKFLVNAKIRTYAFDGKDAVTSERRGFKEMEFKEGKFDYRDSYAGFYSFAGQEVVRFETIPLWLMGYNGGY